MNGILKGKEHPCGVWEKSVGAGRGVGDEDQ